MKIGLIGNMNNNNFALMRYFRDLGEDAHLLLYTNDGQGTLNHFKPESDTWEIEKWLPYIHQTEIPNAPVAALDFPLSWLMGYRSVIRAKIGLQDTFVRPVSKGQICHAYKGYDCLIASGITPATLMRTNMKLDIFYPYANNVEFLNAGEFVRRLSVAKKLTKRVLKWIQIKQKEGIRQASKTLNFEQGMTQNTLKNIGVNPIILAIPMVYSGNKLPYEPPNDRLTNAYRMISTSSISILHHARLLWKNNGKFSDEDWRFESKNSDWFIRAFSKFISLRPNAHPRLFIAEYGPDVEATKELVSELAITDYVTWLPKMQRRELMWLLSRVSIVVGEFYDVPKMTWGGTGWEALASGKPLLQGFNFKDGEFEEIFGYPSPPMLSVRREKDILKHLLEITDHPEKIEEIGKGAREWFNHYNGIGLAKQWLNLLIKPDIDVTQLDIQTLNTSVEA